MSARTGPDEARTNGSQPPITVTEAALAIAATGIPVFPCGADKKPLTERGFRNASTDPAMIRRMFAHPAAKLIGVPTGPASSVDIMDLDPRHGSDAWREANIASLPETRIHQTGGGGEHWVFRHADGLRNSTGRIAPGIDVRAEGGYVVWPGSPGYTVISDADVAPWPAWLLVQARRTEKPKPERPAFTPQQRTDQLDKRHQSYVNSLLDNVRAAPDGQKHDILLRNARALGGIIVAAGISESDAHKWLIEALPASVEDWDSASKTATDGLQHGAKEPFDLEDRPRPNGQHYAAPPPPDETDPGYWDGLDEAAKAAPKANTPVDEVIQRFNVKFMMVNEAGKAVIYQPTRDPVLKRRYFARLGTRDLKTLYMNEIIQIGTDGNKQPIYRCVADVWLCHEKRRQYIEGVVFDPSMQSTPGVLNLWEGFAVKPAPGDWSLMRDHIRTVICDGDPIRYDYLERWLARVFQHPAEQGEVAVVMKGGEGTGKGTLAKVLMHIIGQHGIAISNAKHLIGNFNSHLRDAIFLFADEAFFAGDRAHIGVLKSLITEPYLTIEAKFANAIQTPNFLHVMMASNEDWVVPASLQSRRFLVLDVPAKMQKNHTYFAAIWKQMAAGGYAAMLHDLLALDLTTFNVRDVPTTGGLQQQRKLSLPVPESWWQDVLHRGFVFQSKLGLEAVFTEWHEEVTTELLYASYTAFADRSRDRHPMGRETFGVFMTRMGCLPRRLRKAIVGEHITDVDNAWGGTTRKADVVRKPRATGYAIGTLAATRSAFTKETGLAVAWSDEDPEL